LNTHGLDGIVENIQILMPNGYQFAEKYYKKLKGNSEVQNEHLITANQWIRINKTTFIYFGFLDLNNNTGKDFIYLQMKRDNFFPIYRIESKDVKLLNGKVLMKNGRVISLVDIENFDYAKFSNLEFPVNIDIKNLRKLVKIKKAISITQFYKKATIADKFGYPSGYFWSRFFSYFTSVFSPIVLILFIYPFLWMKRREKYFVIVGSILIYWYSIASIASLTEAGALPYFTPFFINIIYVSVGTLFLLKTKFIEL